MAISRARKEELVVEYRRQLADSKGFVMADYTALTVAQMESMRHRVRDVGGQAFVVHPEFIQICNGLAVRGEPGWLFANGKVGKLP